MYQFNYMQIVRLIFKWSSVTLPFVDDITLVLHHREDIGEHSADTIAQAQK